MEKKISICLQGKTLEVRPGLRILDLVEELNFSRVIVAAKVNNRLESLDYRMKGPATIQLVDTSSEDGMRVYRDSLVFVMIRAAKEQLPSGRVHIEHALSNGLFGEIYADQPLIGQNVEDIELRMRAIIAADRPISKHKMPKRTASEIFVKQGQHDKEQLIRYSRRELLNVHSCDEYYDTIADVMVPSTGYLQYFKLRFYLPGFILEFPKRDNPQVIPNYVEQGKLATVYYETEKWSKNMGIANVASLNAAISSGEISELIRISEAYQEKKIMAIADQITSERDRLRVILIAGPSSSGKTTFAHRLSVQLRVNGLHPVAISLDDYFLSRDLTPVDADGNFDFEALEAIDTKLFNEHLSKLIQGESVELPSFNFKNGEREWRGHSLQVSSEQPIIIEGIHGLNDRLTASIPQGRKFKVYVSALTQLNIDDHTRIPTTDVRLIRRIIRDHQFRSYTALNTIARWPSVRRGEEKYIFPFQEDADVMFNSALGYELAVLKKHGEPLLRTIDNKEQAYGESRRLLRLLSHFQILDVDKDVPCNSILREFIGGSCFDK